jgi:tetratricopeptide (TPR) repeat protein
VVEISYFFRPNSKLYQKSHFSLFLSPKFQFLLKDVDLFLKERVGMVKIFNFRMLATIMTFGVLSGCASEPTRPVSEQNEIASPSTPDAAVNHSTNKEAMAEYHFSMAQAYVAEGNTDRAIEEFKLTLMFDPNSPLVYGRLAAEYIKKGMMSAAMDACKDALKRDPNFVDARLMLAGLYSTSRQSREAVSEYNTILKQDPTHEEAAVYKSQVLLEDGKGSEAIQTLESFLVRTPSSPLVLY